MKEDRRSQARQLLADGLASDRARAGEQLIALRQAEAAESRLALGPVHPLLLEWRLLAIRAREA